MIVKKAYNIRLYPNKGQSNFINKTIGGCKFAYNLCLKSKQYLWKNYGTSYEPKMALLVEEYPEQLENIDSQGLCNTYQDLKKAYSNWFNSLKGTNRCKQKAPKFKDTKSKSGSYRNAMIKKDIDKLIKDDKIFLPCAKWVKFRGTVEKDKIKKIYNLTVKRTNTGKYFASLCCDVEVNELEHTGNAIGLDLGIKDLIITSDGLKFVNKKFLKNEEKKIKHLQKEFSRKKKGSHNREKARLKLAIAHEKLSNKRKDYLHKLTTSLVKENSIICIENLNVKGMSKNHKLAKAIQDASFGTLVSMLKYKALWHNRQIIEIDRFYPSSKTCHCCGYINKSLTLNDIEWFCPNCGVHHDRDINAAINIKNEGLRILDKQSTVGNMETGSALNKEYIAAIATPMLVENPTMDDKSAMTLKSSDSMKQE